MAKSPSLVALYVTDFLLDINTWKYTTHGTNIIETIQDAATNSTTVTDTEYDQYTTYTAWRYETFLQSKALTE